MTEVEAVAVVEIGLPATPIVPAAGRKRVAPAEEGVKGDGERVVDLVPDRVSVRRRRMSRYASHATWKTQFNHRWTQMDTDYFLGSRGLERGN